MGGHGHDHAPHAPYTVPSANSYKMEDAPELLKYQKKLEKSGLKDPWIRNYIWRYDKKYGTVWSRMGWMFFRGVPTGIVAFGITIAIETALGVDWHPYHHAHNDDGHGENHH